MCGKRNYIVHESQQFAAAVQVCFDPQFAMPTAAQVELAVQRKFTLDAEARSSVAPAEKFMMLTFSSASEARVAANELPELLRRHLQKHSGYSIRTHLMAIARGKRLVKEAAERRRGLHRGAGGSNSLAPANAIAPGGLGQSTNSVAEPDMATVTGLPPGPVPIWQQPPLATAPMYVSHQLPHSVSPPLMPLTAPQVVPQALVSASAPQGSAPLPSGFLHSVGSSVGTSSALTMAHQVTNEPAASNAAMQMLEAKQHMSLDVGELGEIAAILATSSQGKAPQGSGTQGPPGASDGAAASMLGLLRQLGSAPSDRGLR
jgi:hypothetical protein